jgi:cytochrome c oxidase cbb3-type subunit IV
MLYNIVHAALREAENVNAFGLFSLLIFFGFFLGVLVWAFRLKKNYLNHMGALPLDGAESPEPQNNQTPSSKL